MIRKRRLVLGGVVVIGRGGMFCEVVVRGVGRSGIAVVFVRVSRCVNMLSVSGASSGVTGNSGDGKFVDLLVTGVSD